MGKIVHDENKNEINITYNENEKIFISESTNGVFIEIKRV